MGVYVLVRLGFGIDSLAVLVVTGAAGGLYLREYAQRPLARPPPPRPAPEEPEEPFEDPVEEADRVDRERGAAPAADAPREPPAVVDDGLETD